MKKLIAWLYDKYCRQQLDRIYIGGLQRDFTKEPNPQEQKQRNVACIEFVNSKASEFIFNEILKEYTEALFNTAETQQVRDLMHNNINVILKVEERIKGYAYLEQPVKVENPYDPL